MSKSICPENETFLTAEVTFSKNDKVDRMKDDEIEEADIPILDN